MEQHGQTRDLIFSTMVHHGHPWYGFLTMVDYGWNEWDHGRLSFWALFLWLSMLKHGWPPKSGLTMVDRGCHFAWDGQCFTAWANQGSIVEEVVTLYHQYHWYILENNYSVIKRPNQDLTADANTKAERLPIQLYNVLGIVKLTLKLQGCPYNSIMYLE